MADVRDGKSQIGGDIASGSTDAGNPVKIGGKTFSSVPTPVTAGQRADAYFDLKGRQYTGSCEVPDATSDFTPTQLNTSGMLSSGVIKTSAGVLYGFYGFSNAADNSFIQFFDNTVVANNGTYPKLQFLLVSSGNFSFDCGKFGVYFTSGISWNLSDTTPSKHVKQNQNCWLNVDYK